MMEELTGCWQAKLQDMIEELGEENVKKLLSDFSCPLNPDVEEFLHEKAILFAKQGFAMTYLVFMSYQKKPVLVGYYALAYKAISVKASLLNAKWRRRFNRYASYDAEMKQYIASLPLIGQLGKNFRNGYNKLITGDELLEMACNKVSSILTMASGKMAYLECEDIPELTDFYTRNRFERFANRNLDRDEIEKSKTPYLVQMIKYFG